MNKSKLADQQPGHLAEMLRKPDLARIPTSRQFQPAEKIKGSLLLNSNDLTSQRYRIKLYRFLSDNVAIISSCLWTWVRLSTAAGKYEITSGKSDQRDQQAEAILERLTDRMFTNSLGNRIGLASLMPQLFRSLYRDGFFGGFLTVFADGSGVDRFLPVDATLISQNNSGEKPALYLETENSRIDLDRPDFYYLPLSCGQDDPLGGSILRSVGFVSYIEQQLVDDMRRSSHNSGFHRLHVKLTPPTRMSGESDQAYTERSNQYFDETVGMIKGCEVDDNPVTWDNVAIEHIGPDGSQTTTSSWFINHRAMIEDICAGTNLAPYLLGYSYGATTTWAGFKFDVVMRQVRSVQASVSRFLEWIGNIELALAGSEAKCQYTFDNTFAYQASEKVNVESNQVQNLLKLYEAGLIDEATAQQKAAGLI